MHKDALLCVQGLTIVFSGEHGRAEVVRKVSFDLQAGETLGLVGESGCGKSTTVLASLGLLPPGGRVVEGSVFYGGRDLLSVPASVLRQVRGRKIGMIFQDSMTSLNPVLTVERQISEMIERHLGIR